MINAALDLLNFLSSNFGFLFSLILYTVLAIALSKSIKSHSKVYYWIFAVISFSFIIPSIARLVGVTLPFNLGNIPIIGLSAREVSSAANFIHPILVIIMYMGALSTKTRYVGRLMSIRKELSIIVGFPVLAHAVKRLFGSFPEGWRYFFNHEEYMQSPRVSSALGSGVTSFAFVLGLVMLILFLVLWITSFDGVRRKMKATTWKSVQRWSYGLYAMLFIHAMFLQIGGLISQNARQAQQQVAVVAPAQQGDQQREQRQPQAQQGDQQREQRQPQAQAQQGGQQGHGQPQAQQGHSRPKPFSFSDVKLPAAAKRYVSIVIYLLVYGSYLYFRLRKAKEDKLKRAAKKQ